MKNLLSSQFRALVAIIVGLLLITFHEETVRWITILIGVMFFLSGVFSVTTYYAYRKPEQGMIMYDTDGNRLSEIALPTFGTTSVSGARGQKELFYSFTSYTTPGAIHSYDMATAESTLLSTPKLSFRT